MTGKGLTHVGEEGAPNMVYVGDKPVVARRAKARGRMRVSKKAREAIRDGTGPKGSVFGVATVAAVSAAKRTWDLIPLCHQIPLDEVNASFSIDDSAGEVVCVAEAASHSRTGVEMEALVGVHVGLATVHDMCKAIDGEMEVVSVKVVSKTKEG